LANSLFYLAWFLCSWNTTISHQATGFCWLCIEDRVELARIVILWRGTWRGVGVANRLWQMVHLFHCNNCYYCSFYFLFSFIIEDQKKLCFLYITTKQGVHSLSKLTLRPIYIRFRTNKEHSFYKRAFQKSCLYPSNNTPMQIFKPRVEIIPSPDVQPLYLIWQTAGEKMSGLELDDFR
jgi:hypothetical protein